MRKPAAPLALLGFSAAVAAAAWFGSRSGPQKPDTRLWFNSLRKPSWNPPDLAFPIVWTGLYSLMAVSGARTWSAPPSCRRSRSLALWSAQLLANAAWTRLFFGRRQPRQALADVVLLEALILAYIADAREIDPTAAACFLPYAAWVAFATALNAEIVRLNPPPAP
jgi:tryptophan-rich sensory protein